MKEKLHKLASREILEFIQNWKESQADKLLLNPPAAISGIEKEVVDQIISLRKGREKLGGYCNFYKVLPPPLSMEQCSSYLTAQYKAKLFAGDSICDLTGGAGVDSLAFSEKFKQVDYVERNEELAHVFRFNINQSNIKNIEVFMEDCENYLSRSASKACFYIDPARRDDLKRKVAGFEESTPQLLSIWEHLTKTYSAGLIKASPMLDIKQALLQLSMISEVHIVSIKDEVKEILFKMEKGFKGEPRIIARELEYRWKDIDFLYSEEKSRPAAIGSAGTFIYEPAAAILKAGAFNTLCDTFMTAKLAVNTHLYTSDQLIDDFPGKKFEVIKVNIVKKDLKSILSEGNGHIITRNYPSSAESLRKKFKLKEKGDFYVLAYRDRNNKPVMSLTKRID